MNPKVAGSIPARPIAATRWGKCFRRGAFAGTSGAPPHAVQRSEFRVVRISIEADERGRDVRRNARSYRTYPGPMSMSAGERRIVSVLVADVAGSTSIAERIGPERSKFLFDEVVALMRQEVERFGGTVAQLTGDGVLALFGAPVAHEDDPERAVRAALAIGYAISRYDDEIGSAYGIEVRVRSAINTGPVVVPPAGEAPGRLYNALGDTVNVAARLQAHGDLVVGPEKARHLKGRFRLEP